MEEGENGEVCRCSAGSVSLQSKTRRIGRSLAARCAAHLRRRAGTPRAVAQPAARGVASAQAHFCFNRSRISASKTSSPEGAGGSGGAASSLRLRAFMTFTTMKMAHATMMKSTRLWMNCP